jgi:hypothetical protein
MAGFFQTAARQAGALAGMLCAASGVAAAAPAPAPEPTPLVAVSVDEAGWAIEARHADRAAMAQELAGLSRSELHLAPAALARARPLTLRWHGTSLAEAWQHVLGQEASYALQCAPRSCRVWVVGPMPPAANRPSGAVPPSGARPVEHPLQPDPPGLFPAQ